MTLSKLCRVTGDMAGCLTRGKLRGDSVLRWAIAVREAATVLERLSEEGDNSQDV